MTQRALLLLDLQNEMVDPKGKIGAHGLAAQVAERHVLANAEKALSAARAAGVTVVHVRLAFRPDYADGLSVAPRIAKLKESRAAIAGTWGAEFPDSIKPLDSELVINKQAVSPFFNTGLLTWLLRHNVSELVLAGVATNLVVESTARFADDAGFAVTVLEDACASPNPQWHAFAVENILPVFGRVIQTDAFVEEIVA